MTAEAVHNCRAAALKAFRTPSEMILVGGQIGISVGVSEMQIEVREHLGDAEIAARATKLHGFEAKPGSSIASARAHLERRPPVTLSPTPRSEPHIAGLPFERTVHLILGTIMNNKPGVMEMALRGALSPCRWLPINPSTQRRLNARRRRARDRIGRSVGDQGTESRRATTDRSSRPRPGACRPR